MKELMAIQAELNVPKNQVNRAGGYKYRSLDDITEAVKPLLKKYHVLFLLEDHVETRGTAFVCSDVVDMGHEDRDGNWVADIRTVQTVKGLRYFTVATATLMNAAGEKISCRAEAEHPESRLGMDPAQASGATSSYARKYAACGLFAIDDNRDPDAAESPAAGSPDGKHSVKKQLEYMAKRGISRAQLRKAFGKEFETFSPEDLRFLRGVIRRMLIRKIRFEEAFQEQSRNVVAESVRA